MPRLNFFTPLLEDEKISSLRYRGIVVFLIILLAAGSYLAVYLQTFFLQKKIIEREQELSLVRTAQLSETLELKRKINTQENYQIVADSLKEEITIADHIRLQLIEKILQTVPQNVFFQDLKLTRTDWQLLGFADDRKTIAKFKHNLKESGLVNKIQIRNINTSTMENMGEIFVFNMNGLLNRGWQIVRMSEQISC